MVGDFLLCLLLMRKCVDFAHNTPLGDFPLRD